MRAQGNKVGRLWFFGSRCSRISGGTPEARLCECRASFLMTFVTSGMSLAGSRQLWFFQWSCMDVIDCEESTKELMLLNCGVGRGLSGLHCVWCNGRLPGASERYSTRDKCHEERVSAYAKAGSSLGSPPGYSRASTPQKTRVCLLYCFVLSPLTLRGAVPHHHLALSEKELTYSSS